MTPRFFVVGALLLVACSGPDVGVRIESMPASVGDDLERVEVSLLTGACATQTPGDDPVDAFRTVVIERGGGGMAFGNVEFGDYGLYARGWNASCQIFAAGCVDVTVSGDVVELVGVLRPLSGPGCAANEVCVAAVCARRDAGGMDAGPRRDTGPRLDTGLAPDAGPVDAGRDAGPPSLACPPPGGTTRVDPVALYTFGVGDAFASVSDRAPAAPDIDLTGVMGTGGSVAFDGMAASFEGGHLAATMAASEALQNLILAEQAFTVEVWATVDDLVVEEGAPPERLVTLSEGAAGRAFTVGPNMAHARWRIRTDLSDPNGFSCLAGTPPPRAQLETFDIFSVGGTPNQLLMTYDAAGGPRAYVNGVRQAWTYCPGTPTLVWPADVNQLRLGDETSIARTFDGDLFRVAIYARSMNDAEASCWFRRGSEATLYE